MLSFHWPIFLTLDSQWSELHGSRWSLSLWHLLECAFKNMSGCPCPTAQLKLIPFKVTLLHKKRYWTTYLCRVIIPPLSHNVGLTQSNHWKAILLNHLFFSIWKPCCAPLTFGSDITNGRGRYQDGNFWSRSSTTSDNCFLYILLIIV